MKLVLKKTFLNSTALFTIQWIQQFLPDDECSEILVNFGKKKYVSLKIANIFASYVFTHY